MKSILNKIAEQKIYEVSKAKKKTPVSSFLSNTSNENRDFIAALKCTSKAAIIAEIKKASPSKGIIREDFNVPQIAQTYEKNGAQCISVLTDQHFFQGHPEYLLQAKKNCSLPILRKDFIIDDYQVYESKALGADCILLIVAMLDEQQLFDFCQLAQELNMAVLVESHTEEELLKAIKLPTPLIGINNRSLHTFHTDLHRTIELKHLVPVDKLIITESGISTREDIVFMQSHGINTFLIGEHLMNKANIGEALRELLQ